MARTVIAAVQAVSLRSLPLASGSADIATQAIDDSNFNSSPMGGVNCLLVIKNADSATHHVTIHSTPDGFYGRTGDVTSYPVPANTTSLIPVPRHGFQQADGSCYFDCDSTELGAVLLQLPGEI